MSNAIPASNLWIRGKDPLDYAADFCREKARTFYKLFRDTVGWFWEFEAIDQGQERYYQLNSIVSALYIPATIISFPSVIHALHRLRENAEKRATRNGTYLGDAQNFSLNSAGFLSNGAQSVKWLQTIGVLDLGSYRFYPGILKCAAAGYITFHNSIKYGLEIGKSWSCDILHLSEKELEEKEYQDQIHYLQIAENVAGLALNLMGLGALIYSMTFPPALFLTLSSVAVASATVLFFMRDYHKFEQLFNEVYSQLEAEEVS